MLHHLRISNFALLEEIDIELPPGLSFFTGETGAGKSILIDAICRLLGARATQDDVRAGASKAILEAIFDAPALPEAARSLLQDWSIDAEDNELILRREISAGGKTRSLINNCSVTLQQLRQLAPFLVDVFGQNEHQTLLDPDSQRILYDESIQLLPRVMKLAEIAARIRMLQQEWHSLQEREQQRQRNIDMLQFQIREIEAAQIRESEEQELQAKKTLLQNSERIHTLCESLLQEALESDDSLTSRLERLERLLSDLQRYDESLSGLSATIGDWQDQLNEICRKADLLRRSLDFEEGSLDELESRLDLLQRLKKKYGPSLSDVLQHLDRSRGELDQLLHAEERAEEIVKEIHTEASRYEDAATEVGKARRSASEPFEREVEKQLRQVAMEKCRFRVSFGRNEGEETGDPLLKSYPSYGRETIVFEIEPNPGEGFRELSRIASGGELSRLMLALKVTTRQTGGAQCLIFDEIDAGVSGRVAHRIGERLKKLSNGTQVVCVTHLPQVAAFGDQHFLVRKSGKEHRTITVVDRLEEPRRIEELARMLSGSEVTETALRHARELREQVEADAR